MALQAPTANTHYHNQARPVDWAAVGVPRVADECGGVLAYDAGSDMVNNARTLVFADRPQEQAAFYRQV